MGGEWLGTGNECRWVRAHLCGQGSKERGERGGFAKGVLLLPLSSGRWGAGGSGWPCWQLLGNSL